MWQSFVGLFTAGLRELYELTGSLGVAIIIFTIITRLLLLPLTLKSLRSQKRMQALQPQIRDLQRKYGKDREKLAQETMKLYKQAGVNPAGGCLPIMLQLPIFFAIYGAVMELTVSPEVAARGFLWIENLREPDPLYILPVLSIVLQFIVQLMATPRVQDPQQRAMTRAMLFMPIMFGYFAFTFNSGAVLYWVVGTFIAIVQQYFTTGWGLLANYLTFLPKDKGFMHKDQPAPALTEEPVNGNGNGSAGEAALQRSGFWEVLGKLAEESNGEAHATQEEEEQRAMTAVRGQAGQRPRRKRR